jgi:peptidase E
VKPQELLPISCLGFLKGSHCPHYDGEPGRRPAYHRFIQNGSLKAGYAADDGAALHFVGNQPWKAVSSRASAKVYRVSWNAERIEEIAIETEWLSGAKAAPAN